MLTGRSVIITGGAGGVGQSVARFVLARGGRVLLVDSMCDRTGEPAADAEARLREVARTIHPDVRRVEGLVLDVQSQDSAGAALAFAQKRFGAVDAIAFCHGIAADEPMLRQDDVRVDRILQTDIGATYRWARAFAQRIAFETAPPPEWHGSLVFSASPLAFRGVKGQALSSAAGAALMSLTRSLALELRKLRISVNCLVPTARTRLTEHSTLFGSVNVDSMRPDEVAAAYGYLLSAKAHNVSGEIVGVAGARMYVIEPRESVGVFAEPNAYPSADDIAQQFAQALQANDG